MITRRAPCSLAMRGRSAAGVTTSDEPMASMRSASRDQRVASISTSGGSIWPNEMVACLSRPPQSGQSGTASVSQELGDERLDVEAGAAIEAGGLAGRAVKLEHAAAAGHLVQAVDVLRDDAADAAGRFPAGEHLVAGVGLGGAELAVHFALLPPVFVAAVGALEEFVEVARCDTSTTRRRASGNRGCRSRC